MSVGPSANGRGHSTGGIEGGALELAKVLAVEIGAGDVDDDGLADGFLGGVPRRDACAGAHADGSDGGVGGDGDGGLFSF